MAENEAAPAQVLSESPLARFATSGRGDPAARIHATERAFLTHLDLRGDPSDAEFLGRVAGVLGIGLPLAANTVAPGSNCVAYWLGPDEWLVVSSRASLAGELRTALGNIFSSVTEVSGGQTIIVLRGAPVRELLAKECPLDLHPRFFIAGQCAQTRVAKAGVLLRPLADDVMEVVVRRSFADYFWLWLRQAAAEYGLDASL